VDGVLGVAGSGRALDAPIDGKSENETTRKGQPLGNGHERFLIPGMELAYKCFESIY